MLPGTQYSPEDIFRLIIRRAWLIVIPIAVGTAAAVVVGERLPKKYRSETMIMVVPQRISEAYVKAAATMSIEDRLATLQDQLLSRSRLEKIILDLDLYPALRLGLPMEEVVQRMRTDITLLFEGTANNARNKDSASFRIMYVSGDARTAQKTTERLASLFIEENLRDRANVSEDTNKFLSLNCRMPDAGWKSRNGRSSSTASVTADSFRRRPAPTSRRFRTCNCSCSPCVRRPIARASDGCLSSGNWPTWRALILLWQQPLRQFLARPPRSQPSR